MVGLLVHQEHSGVRKPRKLLFNSTARLHDTWTSSSQHYSDRQFRQSGLILATLVASDSLSLVSKSYEDSQEKEVEPSLKKGN